MYEYEVHSMVMISHILSQIYEYEYEYESEVM